MSALAQRYAAALADAAQEGKSGEAMRRGLETFAELAASSTELRNMLASPAIAREAKQEVVAKLMQKLKLGEELRNFVFVLIDQGRTGMLEEIRVAFEAELNSRMNIVEAEVISARELSADERKRLGKALERVTGKKIEARYRLDEKLIGGTTVKIGSMVYDGSVREQLNRLREQLES
ncbi:MAG TPA: ATP synthase F1 subunit delta [Candidatus Acidoferrales bacterium]|nr:ATP synthase F1 subunit delta [Candidatus Acidoferrales bacterium]